MNILTAGLDASRHSCSLSSEDSDAPTAHNRAPKCTSRPGAVSFCGFENAKVEVHVENSQAGPDEQVRVQPANMLVRLSRSQSKILRRSTTSASNAGGYLQDIVPTILPRESNVGFMCPTIASVRPPNDIKTETCQSFRRNRSLKRCLTTTQVADDVTPQQQPLSISAQGRSSGHGDINPPTRPMPAGMQVSSAYIKKHFCNAWAWQGVQFPAAILRTFRVSSSVRVCVTGIGRCICLARTARADHCSAAPPFFAFILSRVLSTVLTMP